MYYSLFAANSSVKIITNNGVTTVWALKDSPTFPVSAGQTCFSSLHRTI